MLALSYLYLLLKEFDLSSDTAMRRRKVYAYHTDEGRGGSISCFLLMFVIRQMMDAK